MSASFAYFVRDSMGQDFLFTIAGEGYEERFRSFARGWMRIKHDPSRRAPVGSMTIHAMPCDQYEAASS